MNKAKVTLKFTNPDGTHEKKSYVVKMEGTMAGEALTKAFRKYLAYNRLAYESPLSPAYHRPCELVSYRFISDV